MFRPAHARASVTVLCTLLLVAACSGAAPTARPSSTPRPTPTPDPHLVEPASVDVVLAKLAAAGIVVRANNASRAPRGEPLKTVNATYASWPLSLSEFSSAAALRALVAAAGNPGGITLRAPVVLAGLNVLIEYGPAPNPGAPTPDAAFEEAARALADALDPLLGPLEDPRVAPPIAGESAEG